MLIKKNCFEQRLKQRFPVNGFTLIEIMVSMGIFLIIMTMGYNFISSGFKATTFAAEQEEAIINARRAINSITKEIRGANSSEQGDYPLGIVDDQNVLFYSDIDNDNKMEKVRYYKDGLLLKKVVTEPGTLNNYLETPATTTIAQYVNNEEEPIFVYYDQNHIETTVINNIRLVTIIFKINVTPWRAPNDYYVETDVSFRNLKSNL